MGDDKKPAEGSSVIRGHVMTYKQKWLAAVIAPLTILVLGWVGSWVGYTVNQGAAANTRISVAESRIGQLESATKEIAGLIREDHDLLLEIRGHIVATQQVPAQLDRLARRLDRLTTPRTADVLREPLTCADTELLVRAANGETFCRKR